MRLSHSLILVLSRKFGLRSDNFMRLLIAWRMLIPPTFKQVTVMRFFFARGRMCFNEENYEQATTWFRSALGLNDIPEMRLWLGKTYRLSGNFESGKEILDPIMDSELNNGEVWLEWARICFSLEKIEDAHDGYTQAVLIGVPDNLLGSVYSEWAELSEIREDNETLIKTLTKLIEDREIEDPELADLYLKRAAAYGQLGDLDAAKLDHQYAETIPIDEDEEA